MEENKFEKEVRRELEGLQITPSDQSWAKIEKRIRKKRDRRLLPFLLALTGLFLATGGYWIWNSKNNDVTVHPDSIVSHVHSQGIQSHVSTTRPNGNESAVKEGNKSFQKQMEEEISLPEKQIETSNHRRLKSKNVQIVQSSKKKIESRNNISDLNGIKNNDAIQQIESSIEFEDMNIHTKAIYKKIPALPYENYETAHLKSVGIVDPNVGLVLLKRSGMEYRRRPAGESHHSIINKRKWDYGFTFSVGISKVGNSFLDLEKNSDPQGAYTPGGSVGGGTAGYPSVPGKSFAFAAGVVAKKELLKKSDISIGITYKYFATTNTVGNRIGASADYSYSRPQLAAFTYHNKFHFLEVPVSLNIRLTGKRKLPLYWNGGFHIAQLLATNALQSGINNYFSDNTLFNKTYLGVGTGFYVTIFSKQILPVNIGPFVSYDLSKIADKGLYGQNHFTFLGIRSEILFHRKK